MSLGAIFYKAPWPQQGPRKIAPLARVYGDQPPRKPPLTAVIRQCISAWVPPPPMPTQKRLNIAPLTLTYGDGPPRVRNLQINTQYHQWGRAIIPQMTRGKFVPVAAAGTAFGSVFRSPVISGQNVLL